jgi:hypothetical protein
MEQVQQDQNLLPAEIKEQAEGISLELMTSTYQAIKGRSDRGILALSKITEIKDDATDKIANDLLAKVRATIEGGETLNADGSKTAIPGIKAARMAFTAKMDAIKTFFMIPENKLIAEGVRIKNMRDLYAVKKAEEAETKRKALEREQSIKDEISRVKAAIRKNIVDGTFRAINLLNESMKSHVEKMNLDNWDSMYNQISLKPKLAEGTFEGFFSVEYNPQLVDQNTYAAIVQEIKQTETYNKVNAEYMGSAEGTVKMWVDTLADKKQDLQRLVELQQTNPIQAANLARQLKEGEEGLNQQFQEKLQEKQGEAVQRIETDYQDERLSNEFEKQVGSQSIEDQKNLRKTRIAIINAPQADIVKVLSRVLLACFKDPKFEGIFKRKKGKLVGPDEQGNPVYADWLSELLDFVAKNYEGDIEGIAWKQKISTTAKAPAQP